MALGAAGAGGILAYAGTRLLAGEGEKLEVPTERIRHGVFDSLAPKWDSMVRRDEFMTGIGRLRRRMLRHATGDVLEVAIGTGRNLSYYEKGKVKSVTGIDFSRAMLEKSDEKRKELEPVPLKLKHASVQRLPFEDDSFDTVVDSFGICSFEDPVGALREIRRVLREDGQVLLLEHGSSPWEFMQGLLNRGACHHATKFGCYPNRNIEKLVKDAGLHVEVDERKHFGTTYFLICRKHPPRDVE